MKQYGLSDEVLDGDVTALYQLLISNIKSPVIMAWCHFQVPLYFVTFRVFGYAVKVG